MSDLGRHGHGFVAVWPTWIQMESIVHIRQKKLGSKQLKWARSSTSRDSDRTLHREAILTQECFRLYTGCFRKGRLGWRSHVLDNALDQLCTPDFNAEDQLVSHTLTKTEITQLTNISKTGLCSDTVRVPSFVSSLRQQFVPVRWHRSIFDSISTRKLLHLKVQPPWLMKSIEVIFLKASITSAYFINMMSNLSSGIANL